MEVIAQTILLWYFWLSAGVFGLLVFIDLYSGNEKEMYKTAANLFSTLFILLLMYLAFGGV